MGQSITILCLGDSLTDGSSSTNPAYPYSTEFPLYLRGVEVTNVGLGGWGSRDLTGKLKELLDERHYDIVCLMAGTNDLMMTPAAEILTVLEGAWLMALQKGSRVVALTVLEGQISPDFHANQLELNRLIKDSVERIEDAKLTCYDACAAIPTQEARPDLWGDPVHPKPRGYRILGEGLGLYLSPIVKAIERKRSRTKFRPCIDLHAGKVKQIVGGTLSEDSEAAANLKTNYVSERPAQHYAALYRRDNLRGGHMIMLGPGCTEAAEAALLEWPEGLQVGGGITDANAGRWIERGASKVILTSWLFPDGKFNRRRLEIISQLVGPERLVVDLSCRARKGRSGYTVAMNKWQTLTDFDITIENLNFLKTYCSEFLIHAADVEGLQDGVDEHLVEFLGLWAASLASPFQITYAGGARSLEDLKRVDKLSKGLVDLTIGSALDIFGGSGVTLEECKSWNQG